MSVRVDVCDLRNIRNMASRLCAFAAERGGWARWARPPPGVWGRQARKAQTLATASPLGAAASSLKPPGNNVQQN